ncbi:2Fe-2S ferredoxin [Poriferisphaera corsica]|uniref:2Fe-2S ferredoxin n=1 Tax=Poriferisphaera corsica TaxID=2528020 RepID=A0A517YPJ2_9BACT|nr:2Fe-2S iron-sulfur cluster-binding protein [Poriferisphaera corsica]QDU32139.1 2Fe-2S ferredoxin [Poriferisphaera corsica]
MHMKASDHDHGPKTVKVKFLLEDPEGLTGDGGKEEVECKGAIGENILEIALENGINIEHACGGVCACSTCHIYLEEGENACNEPEDDELDRVEEAPGIQMNSRLSCQTVIESEEPIVVKIPAWNRNAVKEVPH